MAAAFHGTDDVRADFLIEAREILEQLGERMVALEHDPGDRDGLNAVFRGFHTLKGGAGFLALGPMVVLCHAVEDRFALARSGERPLDTLAFDGAQQALDLLITQIDRLRAGQPLDSVPQALLDRLHPAPIPAQQAPALDWPDNLDELDFNALLDRLHGKGRLPGPTPDGPPARPADRPTDMPPAAEAPAPAPVHEVDHTVRIDVRRLDAIADLIGELVLVRNGLDRLRPRLRDDALDRAVGALDTATSRLQSAVTMARMQPIGRVFSRFPKFARDLARQLSKTVELEIVGGQIELDRQLVEALGDPLVHLVRNAIDHGIEIPEVRRRAGKPEQGRVRLAARQEGEHVVVEVSDDGAGLDPEKIRACAVRRGVLSEEAAARLSTEECLQLAFAAGLSTRAQVSDLSGRGVGLDVVRSRILELSGQVQIESSPGHGSRFLLQVPSMLAIVPALLADVGGEVYALPLARVVEVLTAPPMAPETGEGVGPRPQASPIPLVSLRDWLGEPPLLDGIAATGVVLQSGDRRFVLTVDHLVGREDVAVKALPQGLRGLPGYAGACLVGGGRMAMVLDVDALFRNGVSPADGRR